MLIGLLIGLFSSYAGYGGGILPELDLLINLPIVSNLMAYNAHHLSSILFNLLITLKLQGDPVFIFGGVY